MKRAVSMILLLAGSPVLLPAQIGIYQHGTVVRMRVGDCTLIQQRLLTAFGGAATQTGQESCPEYTLLSKEVVFVIVGKSSNQLIPLAETIDFRLRKNELEVRINDARRETRFAIKEMIVRAEWDRLQRHIEEQMKASENHEAARDPNHF
jgi:hypothetical protein